MSDMVNNITRITTQSPVTPANNAKAINTEVDSIVKQDGNTSIKAENHRQTTALNDASARYENQEQRLDEVVEQLNDFVQQIQRNLNFSVDKESGRTVVTVMQADTKEVIRQIPSQEVLDRIHHLDDLQGLLFKDQA